MVRCDLIRYNMWSCISWYDIIWFEFIWHDAILFYVNMMVCDNIWWDMVQYNVIWCHSMWFNKALLCAISHDMIIVHNVMWCDMMQCNMISDDVNDARWCDVFW